MASLGVPKHLQANQNTGQSVMRIVPQSSFIEAAEYDSTTMQLTINFKRGGQYQSFYVYPAEWQQALTEPSFGAWYNKNLKGKKLSARIQDANVGKAKEKQHAR
jgi:KTSC domain-containing protein